MTTLSNVYHQSVHDQDGKDDIEIVPAVQMQSLCSKCIQALTVTQVSWGNHRHFRAEL